MIYRIGIIGAGHIVEDAHLPILKNLVDVEVSWICDPNEERLQLMSKMYGLRATSIQNIEQALSEVDVCLLAIPLGVRQPYIEASARTGTALYVEKPFARTRQEHEERCAGFAPYGITVGFQRRFYAPILLVQDAIQSRVFGELRRIEFDMGQYSLKSGGAKSYVTDPILSGGGIVIESGIHALDQILFSTQAQDVQTEQVQAVAFDGIDYETRVHAQLTGPHFSSPVAVRCCITRLRNIRQGFSYVFDTAVLRFGLAPDALVTVERTADAQANQGEEGYFYLGPKSSAEGVAATTINQAFYLFWRTFLDGVGKQQANHTAARCGLLTTAWVEDIYGSIFRG